MLVDCLVSLQWTELSVTEHRECYVTVFIAVTRLTGWLVVNCVYVACFGWESTIGVVSKAIATMVATCQFGCRCCLRERQAIVVISESISVRETLAIACACIACKRATYRQPN